MGGGSFKIGGGGFSGPTPTPLGVGLNTQLGLQSPTLPGVPADLGAVTPVLIVGDTSDRLSRGLIESRGFASGRITPGGDRGKIELRARSGGGIIVERLGLIPDGGTTFETDIRATGLTFTVAPATEQFACGGAELRSIVRAGQGNAEVIGGASIPNNMLDQALEDVRWFVPPGEFLVIQGTNTQAFNYAILWRELDE